MDQPSQAENPRPPEVPGRPLPPPPFSDDIFDLGPPAPRPVVTAAREEEPFAELWTPAVKATPPEIPKIPEPLPLPAPGIAAAPVAAAALEEPEPEHVLFPGMASRDSRRRYLAGLASEGLFHLDPTPETLEPQPVAVPAVEEPREPAMAAVAELAEPVFAAPAVAEPAPVTTPEPAPAPEPEPEPAAAPEPIATATLGDLYLRQGYPAEAERIFREVLRREPESAAALEGIAKLSPPAVPEAAEVAGASEAGASSEARPVEARDVLAGDLLAGYQPAGRSAPAEGRARKAFLLSRYLERIRRGGRRDVS